MKKNSTSASRRAAHFAAGGTLHAWRGGLAVRIPDAKKEANRKLARGKIRP
jgi:hypothetical protein